MIFLLDNGHGINTPGKRSPKWPDGTQLSEWKYNRIIVERIVKEAKKLGLQCMVVTPEVTDIPLSNRTTRINNICKKAGAKNCLSISVHVNACNGKAKGWEVHTYIGQSMSDKYATIFWEEAKKLLEDNTNMRGDWSDGDPDWDSNFAMLRDTQCPSVLTENLFMDNYDDCKYLLSEAGMREVTMLHINAMKRINELK